jgi:WD40 repeat protein
MPGRRLTAAGLAFGLAVSLAAFLPAQTPTPPAIAPNLARLDQTIKGLDGPGVALAYNEPLGILAAGGEAGSIQCWNRDVLIGLRKGDHPVNLWHAHRGAVLCLATSRSPILASAGTDRKVVLWSLLDGKHLHTIRAATNVRCLALSPDGKTLATGGDDGVVRLWDVDTGTAKGTLKEGSDWLTCLSFNAYGTTLAAAGYDGRVRRWDVSKGAKIMQGPVPAVPMKPPPSGTVAVPRPVITALALSPDPKQLAVGGADGVIHLLSASDGKIVRSLPGHTSSVTALGYHPDGGVLVSASKDRTLRLWNPANGQLIKLLDGHTSWVQGVCFLAQGTRLASVGADRTVRLWDLTSK